MTSLLWGLAGALVFTMAYAYYTVAGMSNLPGGGAVTLLIEFGSVIATVILGATLMGAILSPREAGIEATDDRKPDP